MASASSVYTKVELVSGQLNELQCVDILGQTHVIDRGAVNIVGLEDYWYEDQCDPDLVIQELKSNPHIKADIFTFWQRLPELTPKHTSFHTEFEQLAVLPITTYQHWFDNQIKSRVRSLIRKSEKEGITVRETQYDDDFVRGLTAIFNEAPIRQGRKFWHYGKNFDTVKSQFSRYVHREHMIGAYFEGEMIGLIMLGNAGSFGLTGQIISSLKHRDKSPNNALIAKAVQVCERLKLPNLCYLYWSEDSLAEFKRRCGFEKTAAPRYYVPLTAKGRLALKCGLHRGWKQLIPARVKIPLKQLRRKWNERKEG